MLIKEPGLLQITRAPFLSSILAPLLIGTLLTVGVKHDFSWAGFVLVLIMGIGLHAATNVYNDIYDTLQGTDRVNVHRTEFSGGSGILINFPHLGQKMYRVARLSLVVAFVAAIGLTFLIQPQLRPVLWAFYFLSAFFSKFYTAAPVKLASRGLGEFAVWLAFGPMAIGVAAVSQNLGLHPTILAAMPVTGLSTLSILLLGQMMDLSADKATGKWGVAVRLGTGTTRFIYLVVHLLIIINLIVLAFYFVPNGWILILGALPSLVFLPRIWPIVKAHHRQEDALRPAAGMNVLLHLWFSGLCILALGIYLIFNQRLASPIQ